MKHLLPLLLLLLLSCSDAKIKQENEPKYIIYKISNQPFSVITNYYPKQIIPEYAKVKTNYEMRFIMAMKPSDYKKYLELKKENELINKIFYSNKPDVSLSKKAFNSDIEFSIFKQNHWVKIGVGTNYDILEKYKIGDPIFESNLK